MGIREHLSKETDEKEMKLSDFSLEGIENNQASNVENLLTDDDWNRAKKDLQSMKERGQDVEIFADRLILFKIIFPDRVNDISDFGLDSRVTFSRLQEKLTTTFDSLTSDAIDYTDSRWSGLCEVVACLRTYYSDEMQELEVVDSLLQFFKKNIQAFDSLITFRGYLLPKLRIAFPGEFDDFEYYSEEITERDDDFWGFVIQAANCKLFSPSKLKNYKLEQDDFDRMRTELDEFHRTGNLGVCFEFLKYYRILIAEKVRITDHGLELETEKEDFKQEKSKRPERREF